jgi:hypothetical protein
MREEEERERERKLVSFFCCRFLHEFVEHFASCFFWSFVLFLSRCCCAGAAARGHGAFFSAAIGYARGHRVFFCAVIGYERPGAANGRGTSSAR